MSEPVVKKRVDESWKEQAEKEKQVAPQAAAEAKPGVAAAKPQPASGEER